MLSNGCCNLGGGAPGGGGGGDFWGKSPTPLISLHWGVSEHRICGVTAYVIAFSPNIKQMHEFHLQIKDTSIAYTPIPS